MCHGRRDSTRRSSAIKAAKAKGFAVNVNCHDLRRPSAPSDIAAFLDLAKELGVGVSISPGYAYERAPDQEHFLNRRKTKELFRDVFARGKGKKWNFTHSGLFLDFLAGNQNYHCTPWGMPTRNVFGWQKPCYLLGEGYAKTFKELMETTDWDCLRHRPLRKMRELHGALRLRADGRRRPRLQQPAARRSRSRCAASRTEGPMAPEISLENQRPAQYVFSEQVQSSSPKSALPRRRKSAPRPRRSLRERGVSAHRARADRAYIPYATDGLLARLRLR